VPQNIILKSEIFWLSIWSICFGPHVVQNNEYWVLLINENELCCVLVFKCRSHTVWFCDVGNTCKLPSVPKYFVHCSQKNGHNYTENLCFRTELWHFQQWHVYNFLWDPWYNTDILAHLCILKVFSGEMVYYNIRQKICCHINTYIKLGRNPKICWKLI